MKQETGDRIAAALERQVQQFDEAQARRMRLEDEQLERIKANREADLERIRQENDEIKRVNAELIDFVRGISSKLGLSPAQQEAQG